MLSQGCIIGVSVTVWHKCMLYMLEYTDWLHGVMPHLFCTSHPCLINPCDEVVLYTSDVFYVSACRWRRGSMSVHHLRSPLSGPYCLPYTHIIN